MTQTFLRQTSEILELFLTQHYCRGRKKKKKKKQQLIYKSLFVNNMYIKQYQANNSC